MKIYNNIHEAYLGTLADVLNNYEYSPSPRGQKTREMMDYSFKIKNPTTETIITNDIERNKVIKSYTEKEIELYNSGTNLVEDFSKASKFWLKLANPDGTVNSAYGHLIWKKKSHGNPVYELADQMSGMSSEAVSAFLGQASKDAMRTPWEWATRRPCATGRIERSG